MLSLNTKQRSTEELLLYYNKNVVVEIFNNYFVHCTDLPLNYYIWVKMIPSKKNLEENGERKRPNSWVCSFWMPLFMTVYWRTAETTKKTLHKCWGKMLLRIIAQNYILSFNWFIWWRVVWWQLWKCIVQQVDFNRLLYTNEHLQLILMWCKHNLVLSHQKLGLFVLNKILCHWSKWHKNLSLHCTWV